MAQDNDVDAFGDLLTFYGSQIVSHGGMTLGFVVALFTLLPLRSSIANPGIFEPLLAIVVFGGVYVGLRILYYGTMSGIVTNAPMNAYAEFLNLRANSTRTNRDFLLHARANRFVLAQLHQTRRRVFASFWFRFVIPAMFGALAVGISLVYLKN